MFRRIPFIKGGSYSSKVLGTATANLIAYWPLWETAGAVADNLEGTAARDGAYTGVTLGNSTGPDGRPVPLFDGTNDFVNIYSASLNTAFNGAAGTFALWHKVSGAGVWTDGVARYMVNLQASANDLIQIWKTVNNNEVKIDYKAGGTLETRALVAHSPTAWGHYAITWNKAGDQVIAYYNGTQAGDTMTALGIWAGDLLAARTVVGAFRTDAVSGSIDGWLAHAAVWDTPLTATQILALATV